MMDINEIKLHLKHRYPFLLIDRVLEIIPTKYVKSLKNVTINEPFFQGHFPDMPIMPGVLLIEMLAQNAGLGSIKGEEGEHSLLVSVKNSVFKKPVVPGDQLILESSITGQKGKFFITENKASVDGNVVVKCEIWLTFSKI